MKRAALVLIAGCFDPRLQQGQPCSPSGWCPPPQSCDMATMICGGGGSGSGSDGGGGGDADGPPVLQANAAFVTAGTVVPGNLASRAAADKFCDDSAMAAGLPDNTYVAWISANGVTPVTRIAASGARGWVRPDGRPVADTLVNLYLDHKIYYPLAIDETNHLKFGVEVFTGTDGGGTPTGNDCGDLNDPAAMATYGYSDAAGAQWTEGGNAPLCNNNMHLYCLGIDKQVPIAMPSAQGKRIFVSEMSPNASTGGLASLDAACQTDGEMLGPGTYLALVATSNSAPRNRPGIVVDTARPWVRPDGVVVTTDLSTMLAPVLVSPTLIYYNAPTMVGSQSLDQPGTDATTCQNWTSTAQAISMGLSSRSSGEAFSGYTSVPCISKKIYCIEP
jgi:hypothetical protein